MLRVILYTRPGCHLCEDAETVLASLQRDYPHRVEAVNIDLDPALHARYHLTIPVVRVGDVELEAPLHRRQLEAALRTATRP